MAVHLLIQTIRKPAPSSFVFEGPGALGRAVEHSTSDYWVPGSNPGVFMSGALSSFVSLPGVRSVTHKTLGVKKRVSFAFVKDSTILTDLNSVCDDRLISHVM